MIEASNIIMSRRNFDSDAFIRDYVYDGNDLGANYSKDKTVFKLWAPTAQNVMLCLYKSGSAEEALENGNDTPEKITMQKGNYRSVR